MVSNPSTNGWTSANPLYRGRVPAFFYSAVLGYQVLKKAKTLLIFIVISQELVNDLKIC